MVGSRIILAAVFAALLFALPAAAKKYSPNDVERISVHELNKRLGEDKLVVVDTRPDKGWESSETKIKGASRLSVDHNVPHQARFWNKDWTYVFYCA